MDLRRPRRVEVPTHGELHWPTILALRELGGSGSIREIDEKAIQIGGYSDEQQSVLHGDGPTTEIEYRLAWARTYLKTRAGALDNQSRGIWTLTERGRGISEAELKELLREASQERRGERRKRGQKDAPDGEGAPSLAPDADWKDRLLDMLLSIPPDGFERLAQRLLRAEGFISVTVKGRSGDGGIDGLGVYRQSLVSFPVYFQCKRYRGSVRAGAVRDFRGAMAGRGDKGLLITTGTFTADAREEATREGPPPVDLIDGDLLCDLLKRNSLGVRTQVRQIEDVEIEPGFFAEV